MTGRPLRFCMITTFYPPYSFGGDAVYVHRLSNELARRGHAVEVIHCLDAYRTLAAVQTGERYQDHPNVTVHGLETGYGALSPLLTQQIGFPVLHAARIRRVLAQHFDVIHYHNVSLVGGPGILAWGRAIKLYTMHEHWLVCETHSLFRFNRAPCERRHCVTCALTYRRPPQWWRYLGLLERSVKHVDAFIAPSRFARDLHRRLGFDAPIVQIPLFVPPVHELTDGIDDRRVGEPTPPYFLFVGRLERLKGVDTLIVLFRHYPRAELRIAGTGAEEARLRRSAEGLVNVRFLGHVDAARLQPLYRNAVALIVPSRCYESFALVIVEALRQQTPVIVRNMGAMPEIVAESGGGIVYASQAELLAAMDRLLADPGERRALGQRGYETYLRTWTPEAHLDRYLGLIGRIAAGQRPAADSEPTERTSG